MNRSFWPLLAGLALGTLIGEERQRQVEKDRRYETAARYEQAARVRTTRERLRDTRLDRDIATERTTL